MLELEFKRLCLNILSMPRTSAHVIELSLGALYLHDKFTINSLFPILIGPSNLDRSSSLNRSKGPSPRVSVTSKLDELGEHLFYLLYEKKPTNASSDYR